MSTIKNHSISSRSYHGIHVKLIPKSQLKHRRTKIESLRQSKIHVKHVHKKSIQERGSTRILHQSNVTRNECHRLSNRSYNEEKVAANHNLSSSEWMPCQTKADKTSKRKTNHTTRAKYNIPRGDTIFENKLAFICVSILGVLVTAALIIPNVLFYLMLPTIFQTSPNQTNSTPPIIDANYCGGIASYTQWYAYYGSGGTIEIIISTANCRFNSTPSYYTSISGHTMHTDFTGLNSIYFATKTSFVLCVQNVHGYSSAQMFNYSQTDQWNLSWVGVY